MGLKKWLEKIIPERSELRLGYHKVSAMLAATIFAFPSRKMHIIGVTGTSGKSTTVELIHHLLQQSGKKTGALSSIQFWVGDKRIENQTLRTTLRPFTTQKWLRKMAKKKCEYAVIEVSSHALDQSRTWGTAFDTAVLTNISENEHLDYHQNFADYLRTKSKLFANLNTSARKIGVEKTAILNRDDEHFDYFANFGAEKRWTFSQKKPSNFRAENVKCTAKSIEFDLKIPNAKSRISVPMVGQHNAENILAAVAVAVHAGIKLEVIAAVLKTFPGAPGRLETIELGQDFGVVVDYTYKPSALRPVLKSLKNVAAGRLIVVWGGTGNRSNLEKFRKNLHECGEILDELADEIVLTTDDPNQNDPKWIAKVVREKIERKEGENFFEIPDRYEAIRYGIFCAEKGDLVLVAGRGHEGVQTIGRQIIPFDDREVCREILSLRQNPENVAAEMEI